MIDLAEALGWAWVLRLKASATLTLADGRVVTAASRAPRLGTVRVYVTTRDEVFGFEDPAPNDPVAFFGKADRRPCRVVAVWAEGADEPWLLAANLAGAPPGSAVQSSWSTPTAGPSNGCFCIGSRTAGTLSCCTPPPPPGPPACSRAWSSPPGGPSPSVSPTPPPCSPRPHARPSASPCSSPTCRAAPRPARPAPLARQAPPAHLEALRPGHHRHRAPDPAPALGLPRLASPHLAGRLPRPLAHLTAFRRPLCQSWGRGKESGPSRPHRDPPVAVPPSQGRGLRQRLRRGQGQESGQSLAPARTATPAWAARWEAPCRRPGGCTPAGA